MSATITPKDQFVEDPYKFADPRDVPYMYYLGPLACDKYAITMAYALYKAERMGLIKDVFNKKTTFQVFARDLPKNGTVGPNGEANQMSYLINSGFEMYATWLQGWKFSNKDLYTIKNDFGLDDPNSDYLNDFVNYLSKERIRLDIDAIDEGDLAFNGEPMLRVTGPLWQNLMVEAMTLQINGASSLISSVASQFALAAGDKPLYEFGLRRGQDIGGLLPSRASFIGGSKGSSNCLAAKYYGIPAIGTQAHAFVMLFEDEAKAFEIWAKTMPNMAVFLVDTYNTKQGIKNAIKTCKKHGIKMAGIRLDSGDLNYLSKYAREELNKAGFKDAQIFASNDLDTGTINSLRNEQGAEIDAYCAGTKLVTSYNHPALSIVDKLVAVWEDDKVLREMMKFSDTPAKSTLPGIQDVIRFFDRRDPRKLAGDTIIPMGLDIGDKALTSEIVSINPKNPSDPKIFGAGTKFYRPLKPKIRDGKLVKPLATAQEAQALAIERLGMLDAGHKRLFAPHLYIAGVEKSLYDRQASMILDNKRNIAKLEQSDETQQDYTQQLQEALEIKPTGEKKVKKDTTAAPGTDPSLKAQEFKND